VDENAVRERHAAETNLVLTHVLHPSYRIAVRRAGTVFALAVIATGLLASASAGTTSATGCRAGHLSGRVFDSTGAAGTIILSVTLTNKGTACTMKGFTGLQLVGATKALPTRVLHGGAPDLSPKPSLVRIAHGGSATVLVAFSDVPVGNERNCAAATTLLVRPPGDIHWVNVVVSMQACNHGTLRESPVVAGRRHAP
jgi:Domain of unknown function (DUF4232)